VAAGVSRPGDQGRKEYTGYDIACANPAVCSHPREALRRLASLAEHEHYWNGPQGPFGPRFGKEAVLRFDGSIKVEPQVPFPG